MLTSDVAFHSYDSVGTPNSLISRLNGWPARAPVNASLRPHGSPTHHSGSPWDRYSFGVGLFHPLLHAGLSRRFPQLPPSSNA